MSMKYSSLKDELVLRRSSSIIQDSSLKDELFLRHSSSKIQYSSLKDELVLRLSPSKFIDAHCNISWICVRFVLINVFFSLRCIFFNYIPIVLPPCKVQLGELHICNLVNFTFL